jgi:hypothetical protein
MFYLVGSTNYNDLLGDCSSMIVVNSPVNVSDINGVDRHQCYSSLENIMCRFYLIFFCMYIIYLFKIFRSVSFASCAPTNEDLSINVANGIYFLFYFLFLLYLNEN